MGTHMDGHGRRRVGLGRQLDELGARLAAATADAQQAHVRLRCATKHIVTMAASCLGVAIGLDDSYLFLFRPSYLFRLFLPSYLFNLFPPV